MDPSSEGPKKVREKHAELIRDSILAAARRLFAERGYAQTSIRALAEEAGVAVQTIYSTFGPKGQVLMSLLDQAAHSGQAPQLRQKVMTAKDPHEMARAVARMHRGLFERGGDVAKMLRAGAATDPDVEVAYSEGVDRRRRGIEMVCRRLVDIGIIEKRDLSDVAAHVEVLVLPETFELAIDRGWSLDRYERWLRDTLLSAFLAPSRSADAIADEHQYK